MQGLPDEKSPCALSFRSGRVKGKPIAGSGFRRRGSASNLQLSASCHGLSSLSPPCASAATGRRAAVRPEAGPGPGRTPRGRQNLHFQVVLGKSKSSFPPPPFFSHPMRQAAGLQTGSRLPAGALLPPSVFPQYSPTQPYLALSLQGAVVFYIDISLGHYGMNLTAPFFLPQPLTLSPPAPTAVLSAPSASRTGTGSRSVWHERPVCAHRAPFFALLSGRL